MLYLREYTSGVSGLAKFYSQRERLTRQLKWWKDLEARGVDLTILGDISLDYQKWHSLEYNLASLVNMEKDFQADCGMLQTVSDPTRYATVEGQVKWSTIDHCYVSSMDSFKQPIFKDVGDSDHLAVFVEKVIRAST